MTLFAGESDARRNHITGAGRGLDYPALGAACRRDLGGARRAVAVLGGGVGPDNAAEQVEHAGVMVLVGSAGYVHAGGPEEGVRATVEAVARWR